MMVLRSVKEKDIDSILKLAQFSGLGITSLPKHQTILKKRVMDGLRAFKRKIDKLQEAYYLFVMEDTTTHQLVGTSAIEALTGVRNPFYAYKLSKRIQVSHQLHIHCEHPMLSLVNDYHGCSELCTLLLDPNYRGNHNGLLLSKGRFLFMSQHPLRFARTIIAEMRGFSADDSEPPFWEQVIKHFFQIPFAEADQLTLTTNKHFIAELMPHTPIYIELLSKEVQGVINKPHPRTEPAVHILLKEGFCFNNYVDIFDAGPILEAPLTQIHTVANNQLFTIERISNLPTNTNCLLANNSLDFRAVVQPVKINHQDKSCVINKETAAALEVQPGYLLSVAPLH